MSDETYISVFGNSCFDDTGLDEANSQPTQAYGIALMDSSGNCVAVGNYVQTQTSDVAEGVPLLDAGEDNETAHNPGEGLPQ